MSALIYPVSSQTTHTISIKTEQYWEQLAEKKAQTIGANQTTPFIGVLGNRAAEKKKQEKKKRREAAAALAASAVVATTSAENNDSINIDQPHTKH